MIGFVVGIAVRSLAQAAAGAAVGFLARSATRVAAETMYAEEIGEPVTMVDEAMLFVKHTIFEAMQIKKVRQAWVYLVDFLPLPVQRFITALVRAIADEIRSQFTDYVNNNLTSKRKAFA